MPAVALHVLLTVITNMGYISECNSEQAVLFKLKLPTPVSAIWGFCSHVVSLHMGPG